MGNTKQTRPLTVDEMTRRSPDKEGWLMRYFAIACFEIGVATLVFLCSFFFKISMNMRFSITWRVIVGFIVFHVLANVIPRIYLYGFRFKKMKTDMAIEIDNFNKYKKVMPVSCIWSCAREYVSAAEGNEVEYLLGCTGFENTAEFKLNLQRYINSCKRLNKKLNKNLHKVPKLTQKRAFWTFCKKLGIAEDKCGFASIYPHYTFRYLHEDKDYSKEYTIILSPAMANQVLTFIGKNSPTSTRVSM